MKLFFVFDSILNSAFARSYTAFCCSCAVEYQYVHCLAVS